MLKKKKVVLTLFAVFGLVAESSASGGLGVSAGSGVGLGVSTGLGSTGSGVSSSVEASTNSVTSTDLGISTLSGASIGLGTSTDLGISPGLETSTDLGTSTGLETSPGLGTSTDIGASTDLGVSTDLGIATGTSVAATTSGLTTLGSNSIVDITASTPALGTSKVTLDAPVLGITGKVAAAQSLDAMSTITVGVSAVDAISSVSVGAPKLKLAADVDTSTSTGIAGLIAPADATANVDISAALDVDTLQADMGVVSQVDGVAELGGTLGTEGVLPVYSKLAITADAIPAVPEADAYAMLLAGLGLMGFIVKRRKEALN
ncbi:MAG TPA: PEP-CTERM sorting domain-containing protein [Nitrosospira sp.]|nr:PEP-CTERM sorting domain-containing protein [Nitrosospira sp.]